MACVSLWVTDCAFVLRQRKVGRKRGLQTPLGRIVRRSSSGFSRKPSIRCHSASSNRESRHLVWTAWSHMRTSSSCTHQPRVVPTRRSGSTRGELGNLRLHRGYLLRFRLFDMDSAIYKPAYPVVVRRFITLEQKSSKKFNL